MKSFILVFGLMLTPGLSNAENWVLVGADVHAKFFVDMDSIMFDKNDKEVILVNKKGIYSQIMTERLDGELTAFKETIGKVEIDCNLRVNRISKIDMLNEFGVIVWSSGQMKRRPWEGVRANTHAAATLDKVCNYLSDI